MIDSGWRGVVALAGQFCWYERAGLFAMWSDRIAAKCLAAVDADQVAVDVAGLVAGEVQREVGDVVHLAPTLQWH